MISKSVLAHMLVISIGLSLAGCDSKKEPIRATEAPAIEQGATSSNADTTSDRPKNENDLYIERLNKEVKVNNPDALLDEVNQQNSK